MPYTETDVFCKAGEFQKSIALDIWIIQIFNLFFFRLNRAFDLCNLVSWKFNVCPHVNRAPGIDESHSNKSILCFSAITPLHKAPRTKSIEVDCLAVRGSLIPNKAMHVPFFLFAARDSFSIKSPPPPPRGHIIILHSPAR